MMRSSGLQHCLESPHLWHDATAANLTPKDLEKAEQLLKEAPGKKDAIDQLNTAYLSMYCAAHALLHSIQYKVSGFRCLITVLETHFQKSGKLERAQIDNLIRAQRLEGAPAENIQFAEGFLNAVRKALETK